MGARRSIAVVSGGGPLDPSGLPMTPGVTTSFGAVVAADSGYDAAIDVGLRPTHLVGDLDSISPAGLDHAEQHGVAIHRHHPDKDRTDTALALELAVQLGADDLTVIGPAHTGRLDHLLGWLAVLGDPTLRSCATVTACTAHATVHVVHPGRTLTLALDAGTTFSLLALHGDCAGVELTGATWELHDARLDATGSLGVSNTACGPVTVGVRDGVLTVVVPEHPTPREDRP